MSKLLEKFEQTYTKSQLTKVRSGDTVRVHQRIKEGSKERVQVFEGVVIRTSRMDSVSASVTVRRLSGGIGVEKSFLMHAPSIEKVEVVRRSKVRRNYLSYMRQRSGKSARLQEVGFDKDGVNVSEAVTEVVEATPEAAPESDKEAKGATKTPETKTEEDSGSDRQDGPAEDEAADSDDNGQQKAKKQGQATTGKTKDKAADEDKPKK